MLASFPASMLNQNKPDSGIPNRISLKSSRFSADVFGQLPLAVGRRWTPRHGKRGRRLKGQPTGGHAEQAD